MRLPSMPRRLKILALLAAPFVLLPGGAEAEVVARVSLSSQAMVVYVDGVPVYDWAVSTARRGFRTPTGSYRPTRMHRMWYSKKYDNAPMPNSIFFTGGYAVHGTPHVPSSRQRAHVLQPCQGSGHGQCAHCDHTLRKSTWPGFRCDECH